MVLFDFICNFYFMEKTTITVSKETIARLTCLGRFGESYDDLLDRLLKVIESQ